MSSRSVLFLAAVAALVASPAALAQGAPAHTLTIEIQDLPATVESNGTQIAVPFSVRATVGGAAPCLTTTSGTQYTIALDAELVNSTGNSTSVHVNPKQVTIAGPVLLPQGGSAERTEEAVLLINPGPYAGDMLNATVKVTASFAGGNPGCTGTGATASTSDEATIDAGFTPVPWVFGAEEAGKEMPAPGSVLLLAALGAVVIAMRRRQ